MARKHQPDGEYGYSCEEIEFELQVEASKPPGDSRNPGP